jgi:hypothetical protein
VLLDGGERDTLTVIRYTPDPYRSAPSPPAEGAFVITNRDLDLIAPGVVAAPAPAADIEYVLVREELPAPEGWSLQCLRGGRVAVAIPLAPRGAAPRVRPAVAQAVAVRVLGERGVFVSGWNQLDDGPVEATRFRARRPRGADALPV